MPIRRRTESADKSDALQTLRAVRRRPAVAKRLECVRLQRRFPKPGYDSMTGPVHGEIQEALKNGRNYKGIDKYLAILGWLYKHRPSEFAKVEDFRRGSRVHFARSQRAIEESGKGAIHAKRIPNTPVGALSTLDNRTKRVILADMLHAVGFQQDEIKIVLGTIPDSDRHHFASIGDIIV